MDSVKSIALAIGSPLNHKTLQPNVKEGGYRCCCSHLWCSNM